MALHSFCGILTLQVGVAMLSVVFWVIAMLTFVVNFFEFFDTDGFPIYSLTISTFVVLLIFGGLISFFSAYNESNALCMAGVALTSLTTVIWVVISSLSFYNDQAILPFVCVHNRCPETFWLAPLKYRKGTEDEFRKDNETDDYDYSSAPMPPATTVITTEYGDESGSDDNPSGDDDDEESTTEPSEAKKRAIGSFSLPLIDSYIDYEENKSSIYSSFGNNEKSYPELDDFYIETGGGGGGDEIPSHEVSKTGYVFGLPLVGAVTLFICNFFLFLFSILVLWSYGQELAWTNAYLQDIPEYVLN